MASIGHHPDERGRRTPHLVGCVTPESPRARQTLAEGCWRNFGTAPLSSLHHGALEAKDTIVALPPWVPGLLVWLLIAVLGFLIDRWLFV